MTQEKKAFASLHDLMFEAAPYHLQLVDDITWMRFRIGTCEGLWCATGTSYDILAITNNNPGNGHLMDVIQWFEQSCKRDKKNFRVLEVWNNGFKNHLIKKHGFTEYNHDNLFKHFNICNL